MAEEKKKKKKKKINRRTGLFDRLKQMGRNISSTLTAPQRRVAKEKMERRMEASGIKSQSGESRMRKGKLYETAPKGTRKTGEDKFAPPMSRRKASGEDRFAPKGAGGKAKKFMETKKLNWSKGNGLLPAIIQDFNSKDILMLGFMNEEALERTLSENKVTFFSRTQDKLWRKGDTSGNSLCVKDIAIDCDKDTILVQAVNDGPTCHEGSYSCFGEQMFSLQKLEKIGGSIQIKK